MAFATKISGPAEPWDVDDPAWLKEPPPGGPLPWGELEWNHGYRDYYATITAGELAAWHGRDRHLAFKGSYDHETWKPIMQKRVDRLELLLANLPPDAPITVKRYEWESGL